MHPGAPRSSFVSPLPPLDVAAVAPSADAALQEGATGPGLAKAEMALATVVRQGTPWTLECPRSGHKHNFLLLTLSQPVFLNQEYSGFFAFLNWFEFRIFLSFGQLLVKYWQF